MRNCPYCIPGIDNCTHGERVEEKKVSSYVGIDNGVSGALALMVNGHPMYAYPMPIQKTRKGNEIDVREVVKFLEDWVRRYSPRVVFEEPGGSQSAQAAASMSGSFHAVRAIVEMLSIPLIRITNFQWQKPLLKCKPKETKPVAIQMAKSLWPKFNFLATDKSHIPHDGMVDAMLMCEWARRNNL